MAEGTGGGPEVKTPPTALSKATEKAGRVVKKVGLGVADFGTALAGRSLGLSGIREELPKEYGGSFGGAIATGVAEFLAPNMQYTPVHWYGASAEQVPRLFVDLGKVIYSLGVGAVTALATGEVAEGLKVGLATNLMLNAASHAINMPLHELRGMIIGRQSPAMPSYEPAPYQQ